MRILSIDLPWGSGSGRAKFFGFAASDTRTPGGDIDLFSWRACGGAITAEWDRVHSLWGKFDLILLDQPIGGESFPPSAYRAVERACTNSALARSDTAEFRCPKFQPGAAQANEGLRRAESAISVLGKPTAIVIESFPQLSIPSLLAFARERGIPSDAIQGLKSHKLRGALGRTAQDQLVRILAEWTGRKVTFSPGSNGALEGRPDMVDAMLGLLPILEWAGPRPRLNTQEESWRIPVWLNGFAPSQIPLPSAVKKSLRPAQRARWVSQLLPDAVGGPGIRSDGVISMNLPGWAEPAAVSRSL
jgi:hypothetical protein